MNDTIADKSKTMASGLTAEVFSTDTDVVEGVSQRTGKDYRMVNQAAYVNLMGEHFPIKMKITLPDGASPYPVGKYNIGLDAFYVDNYGRLSVQSRLTLIPIKG